MKFDRHIAVDIEGHRVKVHRFTNHYESRKRSKKSHYVGETDLRFDVSRS